MSQIGYNTMNASYGQTQDPPAVIENWMNGPSLANFRYCGRGGWFMGEPPCKPTEPGNRYSNECGLARNGPYAGSYPARLVGI